MVNRNYAVREAHASDCSHVLFIDSDMVFPHDALLRLLSWERPIVGALYARRVHPFATLGYLLDPETKDECAEAGEMGIGLVLIEMPVFEALEQPYFRDPAVYAGNPELEGFDLTGIPPGDTIDDSIWFSKAARRAGFQLWIDVPLTLQTGHIATVTQYVQRTADGRIG